MKNVQAVSVIYHGRKVGTLSMGNRSNCQFRRMAFNVYAQNMDDHARNFSFICREGVWSLAPAYDLTNDDTLGEHATTINFKGLPTDEDLITVGTNIRISRARCLQIMEEVKEGTKELSVYY